LWRFKVKNFDNSSAGGKQLNADLVALNSRRGQDHCVMEVSFPKDYPTRPFSLRCVSPRFVWYTGHVTAGGSICIEALTTSGKRGSMTTKTSIFFLERALGLTARLEETLLL
jgi:ubiquitin-conjugating enzyme E2 Q